MYDLISKTCNNINDKLSKINLKNVVFLITESWSEVKDNVIRNVFNHLINKNGLLLNLILYDIFIDNELAVVNLYRKVISESNLKETDIKNLANDIHENTNNLLTHCCRNNSMKPRKQ